MASANIVVGFEDNSLTDTGEFDDAENDSGHIRLSIMTKQILADVETTNDGAIRVSSGNPYSVLNAAFCQIQALMVNDNIQRMDANGGTVRSDHRVERVEGTVEELEFLRKTGCDN